ncbi:MAG: hypothetical protein O7D91_01655 [Planctomycetota bacterium]|nr:hypothetical protein [Planctomycetota bacterium]
MSRKTTTRDANQSQSAEDAVVWFSVLVRGLLVGDTSMEREALSKLRHLGIDIRYASSKPFARSAAEVFPPRPPDPAGGGM